MIFPSFSHDFPSKKTSKNPSKTRNRPLHLRKVAFGAARWDHHLRQFGITPYGIYGTNRTAVGAYKPTNITD